MQQPYTTASCYSRLLDANQKTVAVLRLTDLVSARLHVGIPVLVTNDVCLYKISAYGAWDSPAEDKKPLFTIEINFCTKGTFRQEVIEFNDYDTCSHALDVLLADLRAWEEFTTGPTYITSMEHFEQLKNKC